MLTLALEDDAQARFEALRQRWFPPERNLIPAHLTLFHSLPESSEIKGGLRETASAMRTFPMRVSSVRSIGRGVAYFLDSSDAVALHRRLSARFVANLSAQDRQGFRPHVVIQNKVAPETAKETLAVLQAGFAAWECRATGLDLWRYLGGPWSHLQRFAFAVGSREQH